MSKNISHKEPSGTRHAIVERDERGHVLASTPLVNRLERVGHGRTVTVLVLEGRRPERLLQLIIDKERLTGCRLHSHTRVGGLTHVVCDLPLLHRNRVLALSFVRGITENRVCGHGPAGQVGKAKRQAKAPKDKKARWFGEMASEYSSHKAALADAKHVADRPHDLTSACVTSSPVHLDGRLIGQPTQFTF